MKNLSITAKSAVSLGKSRSRAASSRRQTGRRNVDDLGELPRGYGEEVIFLVAQEPHWLFTYWDIDISRHPGGPCFLRVEDEKGGIEQTIEVGFETRNWYIPVKQAGCFYTLEIGFFRNAQWHRIARSAPAKTPREGLSENEDFEFATIPMHLGFQKLVDTVAAAGISARELVPSLAILQQARSAGPAAPCSEAIATAVFGGSPLDWTSLDSERLHSEVLGRVSSIISSGEWPSVLEELRAAVSGSALLSSFETMASEFLSSSWNLNESAWNSGFAESLSSWIASGLLQPASGAPSSFESSGLAGSAPATAASSEILLSASGIPALSSGLQAASSEMLARAALAEWISSAPGVWSGEILTQHAQAALSSWSSGLLAETRSSWHGSPE